MYRATVQLDLDVFAAVQEAVQEVPNRMRMELGKVARGTVAQNIVRELAQEPAAPDRPIAWTSDRQRKFVMAKLHRAGTIPYQRTHKLAQGWRVVLNNVGDGGTIGVENSVPYADYVQGETQQRFLSKWVLARSVIRAHENEIQNAVIDAWYKVVKA